MEANFHFCFTGRTKLPAKQFSLKLKFAYFLLQLIKTIVDFDKVLAFHMVVTTFTSKLTCYFPAVRGNFSVE